ncbi:MAG TPA: peptide deformylase [Steroidobacteraceae bacterium]|nr:peptide deformylase [Steroidobacteraceae bacterium]
MAQLTILEFPDPRLRTRAAPVQVFDAALQRLIADMLETMYAAPGIGLAATQVNVHQRLIVVDVSEGHDEPQVFINPVILSREGKELSEEGCLSVPQVFEPVERAERVTVRAQDAHGQFFERELTGLLAVCVQHEMDHLEGKLFVDYLSSLKREHIRRRLEKERRERAGAPRARIAPNLRAGAGAKVI